MNRRGANGTKLLNSNKRVLKMNSYDSASCSKEYIKIGTCDVQADAQEKYLHLTPQLPNRLQPYCLGKHGKP